MFVGYLIRIKWDDGLLNPSMNYYLIEDDTFRIEKVRGNVVREMLKSGATILGIRDDMIGTYGVSLNGCHVGISLDNELILVMKPNFTAVWYKNRGIIAHRNLFIYGLDPLDTSEGKYLSIVTEPIKYSYGNFMRRLCMEV